MRFNSLPEWLSWQEQLHFTEVDPGLERIGKVWEKLYQGKSLPFKIVTVAGTNGKGSSVAMLESIMRQAGYKTGKYTSPHLLSYNERICVNGQQCSDDDICNVFERIDQARENISLTYFEFSTLASILLFIDKKIDIAILEVGMGGRLDAVNLFDADIALITPISLDHTNWLGNDRETISKEKAGILRQQCPVVTTESSPTQSLRQHAESLDSPLYIADEHYNYERNRQTWSWHSDNLVLSGLSFPALSGAYQFDNAAAVLKVIQLLNQMGFSISQDAISKGLSNVSLPGRFQLIEQHGVTYIFDVTHNEQGAKNLAQLLSETEQGKTIAVLAMLKDKDVTAVIKPLSKYVDIWHIASLDGNRGLKASELFNSMHPYIEANDITQFDTVVNAFDEAQRIATDNDRILVFGSFHTVEAVMRERTSLFNEKDLP
jgi:dihydrofolate synthase/folylpolyglutamate synthase